MPVSKLLSITATALKSNMMPLERPYKLNFSISYWCQSRCLTCDIWRIKPSNELKLDEIQEFAAKNNYFKWIEITGGEPFMRSDMVEVVRAFADNSSSLYLLTIPTNSLCNHEMVQSKLVEILKMRIPKVVLTLSLDGYKELHDRIRGVPGNYDRVMDMARRLAELKKRYRSLDFVFGYTMSRFNQGQLEATIRQVAMELPWVTHEDFHINVAQISDVYYANGGLEIGADRETMHSEIVRFIRMRKRRLDAMHLIEMAFLKKLAEYVKAGKQPLRSRSLDASLFLDSYGNVYPSIMWNKRIGNIKDVHYDLMGLWHTDEADEVRRIIREGKEPNAWTSCEAYQTLTGRITSMLL